MEILTAYCLAALFAQEQEGAFYHMVKFQDLKSYMDSLRNC